MPIGKPRLDEEALVNEFPSLDRLAQGAFFTPAALVDEVLDAIASELPVGPRKIALADPACGAGAFLSAASARFPEAQLHGLELHPEAARWCARRVPRAQVTQGDGLREGFEALTAGLPPDAFEVWVGNPPYNGTSSVLRDPETYARLVALSPESVPKRTSLRDDFAFFILRVAKRLEEREGVLAFVTPATLLDSYMYAPFRKALLDRLQLREVIELGPGVFQGARVKTCVTIWRARPRVEPLAEHGRREGANYRTRQVSGPFATGQLSEPTTFVPSPPDFLLRPAAKRARALDGRWRREGEALTTLVPFSTPGLKTRFDELLVDEDPDVLLERVTAFLRAEPTRLEAFAARFSIPDGLIPKLNALKGSLEPGITADRTKIRPFYRYAGARHRGQIPESARAHCYLDRRLIPRGDHRFRGAWDPHAGDVKLVFNVRELPLVAALLDREGCVQCHRHARFAPLFVPKRILSGEVVRAAPGEDLGPLVPNLSPKGLEWAAEIGGPRALYEALVRFINAAQVQDHWAPAFGAVRELHVTREALVERIDGA